MAALKNITNGSIDLDVELEDKAVENYKLIRSPGGDIYDFIQQEKDQTRANYYIENIRTGSFSQISENYLIESRQAKEKDHGFTINSFETEMIDLKVSIETKLSKAISFFQGIFAGMALLMTITLNLSQSISPDLVRVQDHSVRVISLLTTLGSFFNLFRSQQRYEYIKLRGTSSQIDQRYKCLVLCIFETIFYTMSYVVYNVSHVFAVQYNISGTGYDKLIILTTIYTVLCLFGWVITTINTGKHQN